MTTKKRVRETFERVEVIAPVIPAEPRRWYAGYTYSGEAPHEAFDGRLYFLEVIAWGMTKRDVVDATYREQILSSHSHMEPMVFDSGTATLEPATHVSETFVELFERRGDEYFPPADGGVNGLSGKRNQDGHKIPEAGQ